MNTKKLTDYLTRTSDLCDGLPRQKLLPIVVSDSKGDYLQQQSFRADINIIEKSIVWYNKKGRTTEEAVNWIIENYEYLCDKHGLFSLYLWTGTCDPTVKHNIQEKLASGSGIRHKYWLSLHKDYALLFNKTQRAFNRLLKFAKGKNFEVIILEIPVYCIQACNNYNGYVPEPGSLENFAEQDKNLHRAIEEVNCEIRKINKDKISPMFNCDLKN